MVLWKYSLREMLNRRARAALTLLSIIIGVGIVVSANIATSTTRIAYRDMFAAVAGRAALEIVGEGGTTVKESVLDDVRQVPGVEAAVPLIQRNVFLRAGKQPAEEQPAETKRVAVEILGIDPQVDGAVRDCRIIEGRALDDQGGVVLEERLARSMGVRVDDEVRFFTGRMQRVPVVGLMSSEQRMASMVFMPLWQAQEAFGMQADEALGIEAQLSAVQVVLGPDADEATVRAEIARRIPVGTTVRQPATRTLAAEQTLQPAELGLQLTGGFSLLLATFIIFNTFLMNVGERRRQLAILRAIGATRRQVARMMFRESVGLAAVGVVLGLLVGLGGGYLLIHALDRVLMATLPPAHVPPATLALAAALGFGIALAGAAVPARRASRLTPLEGMRAVMAGDVEGASHKATVIGALIVLVSGSLLAGCILGWLPVDIAVSSSLALLVGAVLLVPTTLGPLSQSVVWLLGPLARVEAGLAHRQILRHRARSTLTVGVLFLAAATGAGMACTILDNVRDVKSWHREVVTGDFFVRAMMPDMVSRVSADMPDALGEQIRNTPGVRKVTAARVVHARVQVPGDDHAPGDDHISVKVFVREFARDDPLHLNLTAGDGEHVRDALHRGDVVIGTVLAQRAGLKPGDQVTVETAQGPKSFPIAALTNEYLNGGLIVCMQTRVASEVLHVGGATGFAVDVDPEKLPEVQAHLQALCDQYGVLLVSKAEVNRMIDGMVAGIEGCLWGILVLGFVVAAMGTVNTLAMNVLEQTRELGLMRVVAMTRRQVRKTILAQAAIIAMLGLLPGTLAGVAVAYLINLSTDTFTGHPVEFGFHPVVLVAIFAASFVIVLAAAWLPAERAARLELVKTLQYE